MTSELAAPLLNSTNFPKEDVGSEASFQWTSTVVLVALGCGGLSIFVMSTVVGLYIYIGFGIACFVSACSFVQRLRIALNSSVKSEIALLRKSYDRLHEYNEKLQIANDHLISRVERLKKVESHIEAVAIANGRNGPDLVRLVVENGKILREIKKADHHTDLQTLYRAICLSDTSNNYEIGEREMEILVFNLRLIKGSNHTFNEAQFRENYKKCGHDIDSVYTLTKTITGRVSQFRNRVSQMNTNSVYGSFIGHRSFLGSIWGGNNTNRIIEEDVSNDSSSRSNDVASRSNDVV